MAELKTKKPGQWYQCLKEITSFDQQKFNQPFVAEISEFSDEEQAEIIAEKFASIPNQYEPLKNGDVCGPNFSESEIPVFTQAQVWFALSRIETNNLRAAVIFLPD